MISDFERALHRIPNSVTPPKSPTVPSGGAFSFFGIVRIAWRKVTVLVASYSGTKALPRGFRLAPAIGQRERSQYLTVGITTASKLPRASTYVLTCLCG